MSRRGKKKLRVVVLMHEDLVPPEDVESLSEKELERFKTEYDVVRGLRELGHDVRKLGVWDELRPLRIALQDWHPDIVFNLLEEFRGNTHYDHNVVSYLELMRTPYTGCNPRGLVLARDKALSKLILHHHRIKVPRFAVVPLGRKLRRPKQLEFPLIVKSLVEEASTGISQASVVASDDKLAERIRFIHERVQTDAIIEQFIEGREIYVGVIGNQRLNVLPVWELHLDSLPDDVPKIATGRLKHDPEYQEKHNITAGHAADLPPEVTARIVSTCKRIYKLLDLSGYARIDFRLTPEGVPYFLEANPNPEIAIDEEFASAAQASGLTYEEMLDRFLRLGLQRAPKV